MRKILPLLATAIMSLSAHAEWVPEPTATDQRIRQVVYNASEVYELSGSYRYTTTIEFEKGETVQYLTLGDTIAWQAHPIGRRVHLKPVEQRAATNLTVVTDRRTYYFRLTAAAQKDRFDATYLVRFSYGSEGDIVVNPGAVRKPADAPQQDDPATRVKVRNCNYSVSGSRSINLLRACDDGVFTYLEFAEHASLPAFFAVDPDGSEAVVNYRMEGKYVVVERTASLYTLRDGKETLCLFNEDKPFRVGEKRQRTSIRYGGVS